MTVRTTEPKQASLAAIDYRAIVDGDAAELEKLRNASRTTGMFYLDLTGPLTKSVFDDVPALFAIGNKFFELPNDSEEKVKSARPGQDRGFHVLKSGAQYYEIARDEFELGKWDFAPTIEPHKVHVGKTLKTFNDVAQTILRELCAGEGIRIPELSDDPTIPSDTAIKLLYKPPIHEHGQIVLGRHTDFGLLTFLWYDEVTTQLPVYDEQGAETDEWQEVPAVDGTVLVNVADSLQEASGGRLHSTVHRVVGPPGPKKVKNGLAYPLRPYKV